MSFNNLPEELQLAIVQQVPKQCLPAVARVSQCLRRCATSELYYFIEFVGYRGHRCGSRWTLMSKNDLQFMWKYLFAKQPQPCTRVDSMDQFLRTMRESPTLRAKVIAATFSWGETHSDTVNHLLDLLAPCVRCLHLSPPGYLQNQAFLAPVTSLGIDVEWPDDDDVRAKINRDYIYTLFCIPTLRALILENVRSFNRFSGVIPIERARTSNIACLSFPYSVPAGKDLEEMLTWPTALRSFSLELNIIGNRDAYGPDTNVADPARFIDALQQHNGSLEELLITGASCDYAGLMGERTVDLRKFHKLRRVGLPREFMVMSRTSRETIGLQKKDVYDLFEILPSSLEELHIEISFPADWTQYFSARPTRDGPRWAKEDPDELSNWLCAIAFNKSNYPVLTKVVLWQNVGNTKDQCDLGTEPGCAELLSAMKTADIEISWRHARPPFGE